MKRTFIVDRVGVFCLAVMVVTCVLVTRAHAGESESGKGEKQIAMNDLPSAVRAAAEKAIAGGALKRILLESEDGQDAYSVEASIAGKKKEFTFAPDGVLLAEEEDVAFAQLPETVRAAAETYFGGSRSLRASKELAKSVTYYEVGGRKEGKDVSVKFSAGGALLDEEKDED